LTEEKVMRALPFMFVVALTAGFGSAASANQCIHPTPQHSSVALSAQARTCISPRTSTLGAKPGNVQVAQYGMCGAPGARKCVNGWVAVCQCYSYGCQWMATGYRC
jgi:hypothetical protein